HNADFAHWNGSGEGYDVVTMWDFLEHVPDPLATMRRASGLLRPQGLLAVLTIDSSSLFNVLGAAAYRLSAGKASRPLELLYDRRHTFYFDRRHTRMLAERAGLAVYEQRFYRAHLGRWLSVPIPWWMRLGGDAVDLASLLVRHPYRQLLVARKATPASPRQ
ncbi:MAG TPA: methyltransferase domain-containing protein, partial [Candidatus Binatia bacterium]|nr:methyltransferase domain-containing protein [Candidatus Binatia bacterium]